ncbi:transposase [bacterium]|nr:transposase [bacterium]
MKYDSFKHHRRSIRLKGYDYSSPGAYYVTICSGMREYYFGEITNGLMELSSIGKIADRYWREIPEHFPNVQLDEWVVMPNHVHGIIVIVERARQNVGVQNVRVQNFEPLQQHMDSQPRLHKYQKTVPNSLGSIIRAYKSAVTMWCRNNDFGYFSWQRGFYDHIIRDEDEMNQIRQYICTNPQNWDIDMENPDFRKL